MKDWINDHNRVKKFQQGGAMAPAAPAAPEGGMEPQAAPGAEIDAMLAEYAQTRDPQLAVAICDMLVEMIAGTAPEGGAPAQGAPMARKGMKINRGPVFKK